MTQTQTTHTRGPVKIQDAGPFSGNIIRFEIVAGDDFKLCEIEDSAVQTEQDIGNHARKRAIRRDEANARLLTAAFNSYDKHFGPRAVEAAEADLLGEALELLRAIDEFWSEAATSQKSGACISPSALLTDSDQPIASEVAALLSKLTP